MGLSRTESRISLELCVWAYVGLWFKFVKFVYILYGINWLHLEVLCVRLEVCVHLGVRAEGVGEKTKEFDELLWNMTCAEAFLPFSQQGSMGRNVTEATFILILGLPHSGETSSIDIFGGGYLGILCHLPTLPFSFYLACSLCPWFFRTHCQYQTTSQSNFLSKKCIVL